MKRPWTAVATALALLTYGCADAGMEKKEMATEAPKAAAAKPATEPKKAEMAVDTEAAFRETLVGKNRFDDSGNGQASFHADGTFDGVWKGHAYSGTWRGKGDLACITVRGKAHCNRYTIMGETGKSERVTGGTGKSSFKTG